jgi:hypothetical protein
MYAAAARRICALTRNISFSRSSGGLDRLGRELRDVGNVGDTRRDDVLRRGIEHQRTSLPSATRPAALVGRKKVM